MGVTNLGALVLKKEISLAELRNKKIAFDAFNILYQFLAAIRQRDGTLLKDSKGRITSHLSGLFYRTINILEAGVKPCFVFDGKPSEFKAEVHESRRQIREKAVEAQKKAIKAGDLELARKFAQQTSRLTGEMVQETKELLDALGLPWVQALADGEAQAAYMCAKKQVYSVASQDLDSLLFGAIKLVRNLTVSERKKLPGRKEYVKMKPEIIDLDETLNNLGIDRKSLVRIAILIGTDYNSGIKGIGPKTALKIVKEGNFEVYAKDIPYWKQVEQIFLKPAITKDYSLKWRKIDENKVKEILSERHEFSEKRVESTLKRLTKAKKQGDQSTLGGFVK